MSHVIRELLEAIVLALLAFFIIQISVQNFRVEGHSMQPTLDGGEYLMVNKLAYFKVDMARLARLVPFWSVDEHSNKFIPFAHPPERNDVIVFHSPTSEGKDFIKRVVGLPGDKVEIRAGHVYINGIPYNEPHLARIDLSQSMDCVPRTERFGCRLAEDQYFVMGDNRGSSNDSRDWGPVQLDAMVGKVWFIYWPFSKLPWVGSLSDSQ